MLLRTGDAHKGSLCVYMYYKARDKHLCICIWLERQSQTFPKEMWEFLGAVGGVVVAAGAGQIPARGAGLETGEDGATFLGLLPESYKSSEMLFFFMVAEDFLGTACSL